MSSFLAFFKTNEDADVADSRGEVAATVRVPKELVLLLLQLIRPLKPLLVLTRSVQIQQAPDDKGIVVEEAENRYSTAKKKYIKMKHNASLLSQILKEGATPFPLPFTRAFFYVVPYFWETVSPGSARVASSRAFER